MPDLHGRTIAFLATDGVEQIEYVAPRRAVEEAGGTAVLVAPDDGSIQAFDHLDKADRFPVDVVVGEAEADRYDALVLPGGVANPDALRTDPDVQSFVGAFFDAGKPVAAICHAPWTLVDADKVAGRRLTSWPSLRTDIRNAGGTWVDEEVVDDDGLITSRGPDDLPAFCARLVRVVAGRPDEEP